MLSIFHMLLHLIIIPVLWGRYYDYFRLNKSRNQSSEKLSNMFTVTQLIIVEWGFKPGLSDSDAFSPNMMGYISFSL